jgi:hypothetical protein
VSTPAIATPGAPPALPHLSKPRGQPHLRGEHHDGVPQDERAVDQAVEARRVAHKLLERRHSRGPPPLPAAVLPPRAPPGLLLLLLLLRRRRLLPLGLVGLRLLRLVRAVTRV